MSTTTTRADLSAIKARQQRTWSSGDFAVVAARTVLVSERLADVADLRAGWRVLDIACGSGNATLAAARSGTQVIGVDYVPELLQSGRDRAVLSENGRAALAADLTHLACSSDRNYGGSIAIPATYLETILTLR